MEHNRAAKEAPCEKPRTPSKGPNFLQASKTRSRLALKPLSQSDAKLALKKSSSRLNHQPLWS